MESQNHMWLKWNESWAWPNQEFYFLLNSRSIDICMQLHIMSTWKHTDAAAFCDIFYPGFLYFNKIRLDFTRVPFFTTEKQKLKTPVLRVFITKFKIFIKKYNVIVFNKTQLHFLIFFKFTHSHFTCFANLQQNISLCF